MLSDHNPLAGMGRFAQVKYRSTRFKNQTLDEQMMVFLARWSKSSILILTRTYTFQFVNQVITGKIWSAEGEVADKRKLSTVSSGIYYNGLVIGSTLSEVKKDILYTKKGGLISGNGLIFKGDLYARTYGTSGCIPWISSSLILRHDLLK